MNLADMRSGIVLRVIGYAADTPYTERLKKLGLVNGTEFTILRRAPLGDPIQIALRGYSLALRPSEATDLLFEVAS